MWNFASKVDDFLFIREREGGENGREGKGREVLVHDLLLIHAVSVGATVINYVLFFQRHLRCVYWNEYRDETSFLLDVISSFFPRNASLHLLRK